MKLRLLAIHTNQSFQLFNEINARKVHNEVNVFAGFFNNSIFLGVLGVTAVFQIIIVEFGDRAFKVTGLTLIQWLGCIVCCISMVINA